jgi:hypothetical protein
MIPAMGAVPVGVQVDKVGVLGLQRQIGTLVELAGPAQPVDRDDAGVDQGHIHALAGQLLAPQGLGPNRLGQVVDSAPVDVVPELGRALGALPASCTDPSTVTEVTRPSGVAESAPAGARWR